MKPGLQVGDTFEFSAFVDESVQASLMKEPVHPLYGTAGMIMHMEWAVRQLIIPYLEENEEAVGYHVDVKHLSPTPLGERVRIQAKVSEIHPRRLFADVVVWNKTTQVGAGTIVQALVNKTDFYRSFSETVQVEKGEPSQWVQQAMLIDETGGIMHGFEILNWEHELPSCTRYDEWLICRLIFKLAQESVQFEGAFLLRHEIEEWVAAMQGFLQGTQEGYQSDFLESILQIQMHRESENALYLKFVLNYPKQTPLQVEFSLPVVNLKPFMTQLEQQLAQFPSRL